MSESFQEFCKRILPVVQAGAEGKKIEFLGDDGESWIKKDTLGFVGCCEYRIAEPEVTPLPITTEMWAMIDPRYRFACMDDHGVVCFSHAELEWRGHYWADFSSPVGGRCKSPLNIDTTGITPELSMTKRPDNYVIDNDVDVGSIAVHDIDEVITSIKKTAEEGRKHGVQIATEEFNTERKSSDSGSSKEEIKDWLAQEVNGGVFDHDLTKRMIDDMAGASDGNLDALSFSIMGLPKHSNVDATHYAKSIAGNHIDLYKRDPLNKEQWMTLDYQNSGWIKVQLFGVEPNPIK